MSLRVTNTLTGETEPFEPRDPDAVTLYYCGLTVSDDAHLGHARSWVHTDVIHRWLEYSGYTVRHVENFTDVNEKIVARVGEHGDDEGAVAGHFIQRVLRDMRSLNLKRVDVYPRVSEHIPEIIGMIERLLERGYAYESNGSVYFDVTTFDDYGQLSNQSLEEMASDEEMATDEKRNPQDFALWKAGGVAPEELEAHRTAEAAPPETAAGCALTFDSPWSEGRPGWHIECSAMATAHLADTFDLHVAGRDILFPHNENEIAQAVAATDGEFARYWLHTGLLQTEGEKMSSSLKNFFRVSDAVAELGPDVIRTFFLSTRYRSDQQFSDAAIEEARERWETLADGYARATNAADDVNARTKVTDDVLRTAITETDKRVEAAMNDDLDTRRAMAALLDLASAVAVHVTEREEYDYRALCEAIERFESIAGGVFGLSLGEQPGSQVRIADELIELILELREQERREGNFERADALRDDLTDLGVIIEDSDTGPTYRFKTGQTDID